MFVCGFCGNNSKHGEKLRRVVVETKTVNHPHRYDCYTNSRQTSDDPGGTGTQIAKELHECESCFELSQRQRGTGALIPEEVQKQRAGT